MFATPKTAERSVGVAARQQLRQQDDVLPDVIDAARPTKKTTFIGWA